MAEKVMPEPRAVSRALYKPGNIRRDKAFLVISDHAEIGRKRGEMIIRYFGTRRRNFGKKRGFTDIGETYYAQIGNNFKFEYKNVRFGLFTLLREIRRMPSGGRKTDVSLTAAPALGDKLLFAVRKHVANYRIGVRVADNRSHWYFYYYVGAVFSEAFISAAALAVARKIFACITERKQVVHACVRKHVNAPAVSAVAAVGSAGGLALERLEGIHSVAAVARFYSYFYLVDKRVFIRHNIPV